MSQWRFAKFAYEHPDLEWASTLLATVNLTLGTTTVLINLLLLYILNKVPRNFGHNLICTIAAIDLVDGTLIAMMCGMRLMVGKSLLLDNVWYCNGFGMWLLISTCASSYLIGLLAIERYFRVCRSVDIPWKKAAIFTALIFVTLILTSIITSFQHGYTPDPTLVYCLPYGSPWSNLVYLLIKILLVLPLPTITVSYVKIFLFCTSKMMKSTRRPKLVRVILFIAIYCACFIPSLIFLGYDIISGLERCPIPILVLAPIGLAALPTANPFLVLLLHHQMRGTVNNFFKRPFAINLNEEPHPET
ncbi:hypothetical protein L0F63_006462 [Massospora cicadina]|nr:hypothetical protein L0F63_006462 [Massospora cicadina]